MPRIRTVKPELWTDEKVASMPRDARLLFIGMLNFADDEGRMRGSPMLIRAQVFPYDTDIDSDSLLRILSERSLIVRYEVEGESFIWIRNFNKHQKIDKPSDSALPPPPRERAQTQSPKNRRKVAEDSPTERKGKEGNGEKKLTAAGASVPGQDDEDEPGVTPEQTVCRRSIAEFFAKEYAKKSGGVAYRWGAGDRKGIIALSKAADPSGTSPAEGIRLIGVFLERTAAEPYYAKNFKPRFIASEINALRLAFVPGHAAGRNPYVPLTGTTARFQGVQDEGALDLNLKPKEEPRG